MLLMMGLLLVLYEIMTKKRVISAVTVWTVCYMAIFWLTPYLLEKEDLSIKRISDASFVVYVLSVFFTDFLRNTCSKNIKIKQGSFFRIKLNARQIDTFSTILLFLGILFLSISLLNSGFSISQIASYSARGNIENGSIAKLLFGFFSRAVTTFCVWSFISNDGKFTKTNRRNLILIILVLLIFGFTRISIVTSAAMIVLYWIKEKRIGIQVVFSGICVVTLIIFMIVMLFIRVYGLQMGLQVLIGQELNVEFIKTRLAYDLDFTYLYLAFQEEIANAPGAMVTPLCYLKPIFVMIPRSLWSGKPESLNVEIYKYLHPNAVGTYSTGYSILGEAYAILGNAGFIIYPIVWGILCAMMDGYFDKLIKKGRSNEFGGLVYAIFSIELVIEGMRGNIQQAIMSMMFPMLMAYIATKKINIKISHRKIII